MRDADNYLDIVALGIISDVMNMTALENRFICDYGLSHLKNEFFKQIVEKQSYSLGSGPLTQIGVAFYITPLINALIRVGSQTEKERLFEAFINPNKLVPSTKRGEKGLEETVCTQAIRNCVNAKAKQNREKEKAIELLDIQIIENCLDENKVIILNADELEIPNTLTGLVAMGVASKYKKPVMLGRVNADGFFKGSIRNFSGSPLENFREFLLSSNYMEFVEGHSSAAGYSLKNSNVEKLLNYCNVQLKDVDFNEGAYDVDFVVNGNCSYLKNLIFELEKGRGLFGQGNPEPVIAIENITLPQSKISIIGSNKDTVRFEYNGITYVKFKALKIIEELKNYNKINITVIGRGNINEWGNRRTPQILIDDISFEEINEFSF